MAMVMMTMMMVCVSSVSSCFSAHWDAGWRVQTEELARSENTLTRTQPPTHTHAQIWSQQKRAVAVSSVFTLHGSDSSLFCSLQPNHAGFCCTFRSVSQWLCSPCLVFLQKFLLPPGTWSWSLSKCLDCWSLVWTSPRSCVWFLSRCLVLLHRYLSLRATASDLVLRFSS